jgi:hypothetical protein
MVGAGGGTGEGAVSFIEGVALDSTSVGGASLLALVGSGRPDPGANGADRMEPSTKQKVNVSSNVRLQAGQVFITLSCCEEESNYVPMY